MIEEVCRLDRRMRLEHRALLASGEANQALVARIDAYLDRYCRASGITPEQIVESCFRFVTRYASDLENFLRTRKYPHQLPDSLAYRPTRSEYDLALMLSTVLTVPRHGIMRWLFEQDQDLGETLSIGVGSGLELDLVRSRVSCVTAYDPEIQPFCLQEFREARFIEREFAPEAGQSYDTVLLIELLEHLERPYDLLTQCVAELRPNGRMLVTLATNLPQFDHLFNFEVPKEFEARAARLGMDVVSRQTLYHSFFGGAWKEGPKVSNTLYELRKPVARSTPTC
jgi:hypothetical protein